MLTDARSSGASFDWRYCRWHRKFRGVQACYPFHVDARLRGSVTCKMSGAFLFHLLHRRHVLCLDAPPQGRCASPRSASQIGAACVGLRRIHTAPSCIRRSWQRWASGTCSLQILALIVLNSSIRPSATVLRVSLAHCEVFRLACQCPRVLRESFVLCLPCRPCALPSFNRMSQVCPVPPPGRAATGSVWVTSA